MKRKSKIIFLVLLLLFFTISLFTFFLYYGKNDTLSLVINDVNLLEIPDGAYVGSYNKGRFSYQVEVIVKDRKISDINILGKPKISLEEIPQKMIEKVLQKQSLKVDVVTGATASSKAILKAIENALSCEFRR